MSVRCGLDHSEVSFNKEFQKMIGNKKDFVEKMKRNDYYLPKGPFCNIEYMFGVLNKQYYCPTYTDVRLRPCPTPPPKSELLDEVI